MRNATQRLIYLAAALLSAAGWRGAVAAPELADSPQRLARDCPEGRRSLFYARVNTETDPLLIRSAPNGRIIGAAPKDWLVVISERDPSGRWARIGNHWSHWDNQLVGGQTASAPDFRVGWVSTDYLTNLGEFCEKPELTAQVQSLPVASDAQAQLLVQEDWLALGDRLAARLPTARARS